MMNVGQFRTLIVRPSIKDLKLWSQAAENLLVGTALAESRLEYIKQVPYGPALGFFQMEPATHDDLWTNYLKYGRAYQFRRIVLHHIGRRYPPPERLRLLTWDLKYATMMCRLQYWRRPEPLPKANDVAGLAMYWKAHYNTSAGKGKPAKFVELYHQHAEET